MRLGTRPRQRLTLAVTCAAQVMMVLDVMIVSVALPSLQRELHLSPAGLEWVVSAYALALAALIPAGGALGDHFGRKRVFMSGIALFMLASVGCVAEWTRLGILSKKGRGRYALPGPDGPASAATDSAGP